jgi:hypothetical protein
MEIPKDPTPKAPAPKLKTVKDLDTAIGEAIKVASNAIVETVREHDDNILRNFLQATVNFRSVEKILGMPWADQANYEHHFCQRTLLLEDIKEPALLALARKYIAAYISEDEFLEIARSRTIHLRR